MTNKNILKEDREKSFRKILLIAFALSGFTALVYEVVWARQLQIVFGSTVYTSSTILASFLAGFALGAFVSGNKADTAKNPAKIFAYLQLGTGAFGFLSPLLFSALLALQAFIPLSGIASMLNFIICFAVILIPATMLGAVWPFAMKAYALSADKGKDIGKAYAFNSFGSMFGALIAGFALMPLFGLKNSAMIAASLNVLAALVL
ncbi:MAG: fused MFS/spermidine synthase, partial [Nanoarchaeota archaeon]|nr:fused MFS/spermidine synthase [Nanoarchaeota archaeon]